jgi:hypothetical protein
VSQSSGTGGGPQAGAAALRWGSASGLAASTHAPRWRVRMAAKPGVEAVRWVPRAWLQPRALQVARNVARHRGPASWASQRCRQSGTSVPSKPGACTSRRRAYCQAMQRRTAAAACRAVSPARDCLTTTRAKRQGGTAPGRPSGGERSAQSCAAESVPNSARRSPARCPLGKAARTAAAVVSGMGGRGSGRQRMAPLLACEGLEHAWPG